jgi:hypothetical protein
MSIIFSPSSVPLRRRQVMKRPILPFRATTDFSLPTTFRIDDVSLR